MASIVSSINEVVAISSSLFAQDANIKFFKNIASGSTDLGGYWETMYDGSPTATTTTALLDFTMGYATSSIYNVPVTPEASQNEKIKIYRMMASTLLGDPDATFTIDGVAAPECFFIMTKRTIQKDEIKKGSTSLILNMNQGQLTASDTGAVTAFKQTIGGDYAPLFSGSSTTEVGQVWYNAGVIVLKWNEVWGDTTSWSGSYNVDQAIPSGTINQVVDGLRRHMERIDFHNQTNLLSTAYFATANHSEFNYSSNSTFVDDNKRIIVTSGSNILQTRTYITTIGLYDANDNLLAVAKLNKPIAKSPDTMASFRVRLDY